jgi:MFS family permease
MAHVPDDSPASRSNRSKSNGRSFLSPLAERNFRRFYIGYVTSVFGTSMSSVAVIFAVLGSGGGAAELGYVMAARIIAQVVFILGGGVLADRLGRRPVMLAADLVRSGAQAALAVALFAGRPRIWLFTTLAALVGAAEAFFGPALGALTAEIAPRDQLGGANALTGLAESAASVAGPALAGIVVAAAGPAVVIAADAASYAVSLTALALLRLPRRAQASESGSGQRKRQSPRRDLRDGWAFFASCTWLWVTTVQFALFNLLTRAPYLVLGPVISAAYLGGARAWGAIMAASGAGSIAGGLLALGARPRRPLLAATLATFGYPVPCLLLALRAPVCGVAAGGLLAGIGSALFNAFWMTTLQQRVAGELLARADSFVTFGAFGLGAAGLAAAGPAAASLGAGRVLGFGAAWATLSSLVVLALPAIRRDGGGIMGSGANRRGPETHASRPGIHRGDQLHT